MKIAHLINPFKCSKNNPSYLYYAQPITFKSMRIAQFEARKNNINVDLYSINYPEDDIIVPKYFKKLPHLKLSTKSLFKKISGNKKLPIIQEMFNSILNNTDSDYIIFTNSDIGLQRNFYKKVNYIINKFELKSFIINRRDNIPKFINGRRLSDKNLNLIYKIRGLRHPGKDCFVIHRSILKKINMGNMFIGYPPWGNTLWQCLLKVYKKTYVFRDVCLTFHIGADKSWDRTKKHLLWMLNEKLSKKLI